MMHRAWSSIVEVPYCFSRSSVKFQGHTALKIVEFDPNWAFPDCKSSLNSPMAMKCCTKLETAKERCPIVFQGHPSNFKVTRDKTSPIFIVRCGNSIMWDNMITSEIKSINTFIQGYIRNIKAPPPQCANAQNRIMTDDYINLEISCQNFFFRISLRNVH